MEANTDEINLFQSMHDVKLTDFEDYCSAKKQLHTKLKKESESRTTCYFSQDQMDANIINLILNTFLPWNIVEDPSFRKIFDGKSYSIRPDSFLSSPSIKPTLPNYFNPQLFLDYARTFMKNRY